MVGYADNNTRGTYKLYKPETKRVVMTRDVKWEDWKITNPVGTLEMFCESNKEDLVPGTDEDIIPTSESDDKILLYVMPDEGEKVRPNEISENSSDLTYQKKDADADTPAYDILLNVL